MQIPQTMLQPNPLRQAIHQANKQKTQEQRVMAAKARMRRMHNKLKDNIELQV